MSSPVLRSIGGGFRVVGPLTLANAFTNPSFEAGTANWAATSGRVSFGSSTDHVKYGTKSLLVTVAGGASTFCGVSQFLGVAPRPGEDYTAAGWVYIPSTLPAPLTIRLNHYDSDHALITTQTSSLGLTTATTDWVKFSYIQSVTPDGTFFTEVAVGVTTATATSFYLDGMVWCQGDTADYVDGDFANYVWSGVPLLSTTLLSTAPDALRAFNTGTHTVTPVRVVS